MAKVSTERIVLSGAEKNDFKFSYDINVDKEGLFSTTLPKDIVKLFQDANVSLSENRLGNPGYLCDKTLDGLKMRVKEISLEYLSREIIVEKVVLEYCIQTQCSYALDKEKNICPNPGKEWTAMGYNSYDSDYNENNKWVNGTVDIHATNRMAFGFQIYVKPQVKRVYKYKSGTTKTEYEILSRGGEIADHALQDGYYLRWLDQVACIDHAKGMRIQEMDYSEEAAEFFVNMIKAVCNINEKIKDFLSPEALSKVIANRIKLLG